MKKFLSLVLCFVSLISVTVFADNSHHLSEKLGEIWLSNIANTETLENILKVNKRKTEEYIALYLITPGYARGKVGISTDDDVMIRQVTEMWKVDEGNIIKVYYLKNREYARQYASENSLKYLISDDYYWFEKSHNKEMRYNADGSEYAYKNNDMSILGMDVITLEMIDFVRNEEKIITLLENIDIESIKSFKIVALNQATTCLYIDCGTKEYIVALHIGKGYNYADGVYVDEIWLKNIEPFKLYTAEDFLQIISDEADVMNSTKQIFDTEAEALQEKGLLYGTENGLDLLKPLTRIETATILLRALGESTTNETAMQTFADVPVNHWGYGAAENAYSLGLIKGVGDDMFAPDDMITGPQFATMVLRAGNRPNFNWEEALEILINTGVISAEDASTMNFFTRGDMAKIIYESIEKGLF